MKILFVSSLYPNALEPDRAPYNRQLIGALAKLADVRVMAPVPWFPGQNWLRGLRLPPPDEILDGIPVSHPRVFYTPGFWVHRHAGMYRRSVRPAFAQAVRAFRPDRAIIGFAYPDGVAVSALCRDAGLPYSIRINGSDFRVRIRQPRFRGLVLDALRRAPRVLCPGEALKRDLAGEGIEVAKIVSFDNGVDAGVFRWRNKEKAIAELERLSLVSGCGFQVSGLKTGRGPVVVYAGNLAPVKGVDRLIDAWKNLVGSWPSRSAGPGGADTPALLLIGQGPMRRTLERRVRRLGIADRVIFLGPRPHTEVGLWMNAADCLVLASRSEGMPNVVVEALASGLPVVASAVGEVPFLVRDGENGYAVDPAEAGFAERLGGAIRECLDRSWDRERIAAGMRGFTWEAAAKRVLAAAKTTP